MQQKQSDSSAQRLLAVCLALFVVIARSKQDRAPDDANEVAALAKSLGVQPHVSTRLLS